MSGFTAKGAARMLLIALVILVLLGAALLFANWKAGPVVIDGRDAPLAPAGGAEITIFNWNIGYAGLGEASDFVADGGKHLRAASRSMVEENLAGIRRAVAGTGADIYLFQETAGPGFLTRGVDVIGGLREELTGYRSAFSADVSTRFLPPAWSLSHGPATFTRIEANPTEIVPLPQEPNRMGGVLPRRYHAQVTRLALAGQPFVVVNVHLSAFDEGAKTRRRQLDAVLAFAKAEFERGAAVILGGDWNLLLAETKFPHTTEQKYLFWVHPFPAEALPPGWRIAADPATPTVRTNERPYRPGENYVAVIDGFIVSPNVEVVNVKNTDLGFKHSDHQPVLGRFARTPTP